MGIIRTVDRKAIVVLLAMADFVETARAILDSIRTIFRCAEISRPADMKDDWFMAELAEAMTLCTSLSPARHSRRQKAKHLFGFESHERPRRDVWSQRTEVGKLLQAQLLRRRSEANSIVSTSEVIAPRGFAPACAKGIFSGSIAIATRSGYARNHGSASFRRFVQHRPAHSKRFFSCLPAQPRARLTPIEIHRRAGFARNDLQQVIDALRGLCRQGRLVRLKKNHYALPDRQNLVTGRIQAHPDGYGFLIPDDKDAEDLYINRREMRRVMHGDRVMARNERKPRGGSEAHIVQVLERAQKRLVGTYNEIDRQGYLIPMDARIAPVRVNTAGKKPNEGKVIAAEISRYGTAMSAPEAHIVTSHRRS